jgi:type III pantothenate kinase
MSRTICLDFGNTRLKCAFFSDAVLEKVIILEDGRVETIRDITDTYKPEKSILSSVIDQDPEI